MSLYLVDSNFFIQAHRAYYPLDVVTSFWVKISELAGQNKIISIDKVKNEIYDNSTHEDELKAWCVAHLPESFFNSSEDVIAKYVDIVNWANSMNHHYKPSAIEEFLGTDLADSWLVAFAMAKDCTIVTYEKSEPLGKRRIKIPEVCNQFGVRYVNTVDMLRELNENI